MKHHNVIASFPKLMHFNIFLHVGRAGSPGRPGVIGFNGDKGTYIATQDVEKTSVEFVIAGRFIPTLHLFSTFPKLGEQGIPGDKG